MSSGTIPTKLIWWPMILALAAVFVLIAGGRQAFAQADVFSSITELNIPVAPGAREPSLFALEDGRVLMSWTEPIGEEFAVMTTVGDSQGWAKPQTVVRSGDLFVNWADFPSIAAFPDGTLAAHWLIESGATAYDYDVNIALSKDNGVSWGRTLVPHRDGTNSQHGFVTLLPYGIDRMVALWLDARAYGGALNGQGNSEFPDAMQLRATMIGSDGEMSEDVLLDAQTCSCCQTSAAATGDGTVLVAFRDRTADEIRDISIIRLINGAWIEAKSVHSDSWQISGCPVNGPAIDADGERVVVAWFTAADDIPVVNLAFSEDSGENFSKPFRVDLGEGVGRVDVLQLGDGSALVSWVEWRPDGEALLVCRASPKRGCRDRQVVTLNKEPGSINFPKMAPGPKGVYIAWTQPLSDSSLDPEHQVTVRMVLAEF